MSQQQQQRDFFNKPNGVECTLCKIRIKDYQRHITTHHHKLKEQSNQQIYSLIDGLLETVNSESVGATDSQSSKTLPQLIQEEQEANADLKQRALALIQNKYPHLEQWYRNCFHDSSEP